MDYGKTQGFPCIQPDGGSWVQAYQCTVRRMQWIRIIYIRSMKWVSNMSERFAIYRQRQAQSNGWQAWSNDSQSAWKKHAIRVLLPDWWRRAKRNKALEVRGFILSSFDPHNMCAKVERVTKKTRCTSCTNLTMSFKVRGFQTKIHLFQRHFIFLNFYELKTFFAFNMHHSKPHTKIWTISDFICYFSCI